MHAATFPLRPPATNNPQLATAPHLPRHLPHLVLPYHAQSPPAPAPAHAVHIRFDQQNAPPAALLQVFHQRGIRHTAPVEAAPLILDDDLRLFARHLGFDADLLAWVALVAV